MAQAQQWPAKPVRVIVNVAPGGVADVTMRILGARLTETLGQPFLVENRAGGDGYIGFEAVARADARTSRRGPTSRSPDRISGHRRTRL